MAAGFSGGGGVTVSVFRGVVPVVSNGQAAWRTACKVGVAMGGGIAQHNTAQHSITKRRIIELADAHIQRHY